jgi:hypothetical protein
VNHCFPCIKQEKTQRYGGYRAKKHIPTIWEGVPPNAGPTWHSARSADLASRLADLGMAHLSVDFAQWSSTASRIASHPLFQVGLIWGLTFIPPAYISRTLPPGSDHPKNANSYSLVRISWEGSHERINLSRAAFKRRLVPIRISL